MNALQHATSLRLPSNRIAIELLLPLSLPYPLFINTVAFAIAVVMLHELNIRRDSLALITLKIYKFSRLLYRVWQVCEMVVRV